MLHAFLIGLCVLAALVIGVPLAAVVIGMLALLFAICVPSPRSRELEAQIDRLSAERDYLRERLREDGEG